MMFSFTSLSNMFILPFFIICFGFITNNHKIVINVRQGAVAGAVHTTQMAHILAGRTPDLEFFRTDLPRSCRAIRS